MNDFRYWLFDDYDNRGSEMLIGKFATMEEVRAAAKAWESETDGRCSLLLKEKKLVFITGNTQAEMLCVVYNWEY